MIETICGYRGCQRTDFHFHYGNATGGYGSGGSGGSKEEASQAPHDECCVPKTEMPQITQC